MPATGMALSQHQLFTLNDCENISNRVLALRDHWARRSDYGFFSLGRAAYLDAPNRNAAYRAQARASNVILREHFSDIYEIITAFFNRLLHERVNTSDEVALPGFHVFEFNGRWSGGAQPASRAHFDLQWMHAFPGIEPRATLSFTIAIAQPTGGAAMEVWPLRYNEFEPMIGSVIDYARTHPSQRLAYCTGGVVVHDGHVLHAIGSADRPDPCGLRITLQGHGALLDDKWLLYW
jgi:hypothetical protein